MSRNSKRPRQKPPSDPRPVGQNIPGEDLDDEAIGRCATAEQVLLHNDAALTVLVKPAGIPIEGILEHLRSLGNALADAELPTNDALPQAVYPLDPDASGLLLIASTMATASQLRQQMAEGALELRCLALIRGRPGSQSGSTRRPLLDNSVGGGMVRVDEAHGQPAVTDWRLLESYIGFALLECIPRTAVAAQIRVHLQAEGMPLVVDPRYGGGSGLRLSSFKAGYRPSRRREERPLIQRLTLHAQTLAFNHPTTGQRMQFESLPPKDLKAALHQLDRFGRMAP
jgi:23S rRNA pseudouridine1911/1915/1917 synthase